MMVPVDILGAGAFGTALAIALGRAGHPVTLWAREGAEAMEVSRENARRLPGAPLPDMVTVTARLSDLRADLCLLAVPTQQLMTVLKIAEPSAATLVSCAKGIDRSTGLGPTALIARICRNATVAQLTGPSFAVDIAAGLPTALTLACADADRAKALQGQLATPNLRLYTTTDVLGAELGGALKNVVAIAAGAVIGGGLGDSARAALMARGFAEMTRVATALGAQPETLTGLSGLGDLILTCTSEKSRNFRFGFGLARGNLDVASMTVEGVHTARELASRADLDTPISDAVAALADGRADFHAVLDTLLSRPLKPE